MPSLIKAITIFLLAIAIFSCVDFRKPVADSADRITEGLIHGEDSSEIQPQNLLFGIPVDSLNVISGRIKRNGLLSQILPPHGIPVNVIEEVLRNSSQVFDVRKLRAGNNYFLLCDNDSAGRARYMIYEHDPAVSYIFSFNDSLNITPFRKVIEKKINYSTGMVETSLWEAMVRDSLNPMLANKLSEIFAWTVDFFGLQKGDNFKVIYEELYIDNISQGIGRIFGAQFTWTGKTITAIPFIQNGVESYYDSEGNSLRKAFLKAPLQFSRISSRFSSSRFHPILRYADLTTG